LSFLREVDPRDVLWDDDVFHVAETYTRLVSRIKHVRPMLQDMGRRLKDLMEPLVEKGVKPRDLEFYIHYTGKIFEQIEGISAPADKMFRYAYENTLNNVVEAVNEKWGTHFQVQRQARLNKSVCYSCNRRTPRRTTVVGMQKPHTVPCDRGFCYRKPLVGRGVGQSYATGVN
jgi:hypothetical protein